MNRASARVVRAGLAACTTRVMTAATPTTVVGLGSWATRTIAAATRRGSSTGGGADNLRPT